MNSNFRTYNLAVQLYRDCAKLKAPRHLKDQLLRASSSIALNLAEGRGRRSIKEQRQFFNIAFGSLRETQAVLDLLEAPEEIKKIADFTAAHLFCLMKSLES